MSGFQCPYCSLTMSITDDTHYSGYPAFNQFNGHFDMGSSVKFSESCVEIEFYKCPHCEEYTIRAIGKGDKVKSVEVPIKPFSLAKQFPSYIPEAIRTDYTEASAIISLSPKASATLSRRCLQGMIRDFWGIHKSRLVDEINALQDKIPATQWKVIDSVRRIGNIGAHMETDINVIVDIDPDEAQKLIKLIEQLLKQWYIDRYEQEQLFHDIIGIDESKQECRKNSK